MANGMNIEGPEGVHRWAPVRAKPPVVKSLFLVASAVWASPIVFGLFMAACLPLLGSSLAGRVSPFAGTVVVFGTGALLLLPACLKGFLRDTRPSGRLLTRAFLAGVLLLLATSFVVIGLGRGANPLAATLFLSLLPSFSLLGRKLLWGESLRRIQKAGLFVSILAAAFWLTFSQASNPFAGIFLPASRNSSFLGDAAVFLGALLMGFGLAAGRPSEVRVSVSTWWFLVVGFAFVASLPIMYAAHVYVNGAQEPFSGLTAQALRENPQVLLPYALFGMAHLFLRQRLLGQSGVQLSVGTTSLASGGALLLAGTFFAGVLGFSAPVAHFVMLPLHLFGLCLCRDALVPSHPYPGLKEVGPRKATASLRVAK